MVCMRASACLWNGKRRSSLQGWQMMFCRLPRIFLFRIVWDQVRYYLRKYMWLKLWRYPSSWLVDHWIGFFPSTLVCWYHSWYFCNLGLVAGYKTHERKSKTYKFDKSNRLKKKQKEKESSMKRSKSFNHRPSKLHSDDDEDDSVPASYHTVSLQVSQDVSIAGLSDSSSCLMLPVLNETVLSNLESYFIFYSFSLVFQGSLLWNFHRLNWPRVTQ